MNPFEREIWDSTADFLDPTGARRRKISPEDEAALTTPVTLAAHLQRSYRVRAHLTVIGDAYARMERGEIDRIVLNTPPQVGKPVYDEEVILMADGSRRELKDVAVGDYVITHTGTPRRVSAVHIQGNLPSLLIKTSSGREATAAYDHPFLTPEGWVQAKDLVVGQMLACVPTPQTTPTSTLTAHEARLMGYFIGDGSTGAGARPGISFAATITTASNAVDAEIRRCADLLGFNVGTATYEGRKAWALSVSGGVRPWLRSFDGIARRTSHTKRVPEAVFTASPEVIAEFIGGYWDCDGVVTSRGKDRAGGDRSDVHLELYSVSRELLADVQHLLLRLGILANIRVKKGSYKDAEHISYRLQIISRDDVATFRSKIRLVHETRRARLEKHPFLRTSFPKALAADPIVSIEEVGELPCRCLTVEVDHTFTAGDLVVHNTVTAVVWAAFWYLILHPTHRVIIVCYGDSLAVKRGLSTRRLVEEFGKRYGLALDPAAQAAHNWSLTTGGGIRSVGIGAGITGEPGDFIIIDDPHKNREEAESPTFREKVHDAYSADILTRRAPNAPLALVMTRWHPDDLAGRVMAQEGVRSEGGRWELLHMPAIATELDDPLGRSIGDPLPHPKIQEHDRAGALAHWENARNTNVPRDWFSMYQADPRPVEGAMVSGDILRQRRCYEFGTERPCAEGITHAVAIDPSGGGRDTAGVVAGYLGDDQRLYVTHDWSARMKSEDWSRKACELAVLTKADRFVIEKNYGGDLCQLAVRTAWVQLAAEEQEARAVARAEGRDPGPVLYGPLIPRVVEVTARKNKILRAEPIAQQIIMDRVRFAAYLPGIEHQWQTFLPTSKDSPGNLDACVYLGYDLLPMPASGETQFQESPDMAVDLTRALSPADGMMGGYGGVGDWR